MRILAASAFFISRPRSGPTSREPEPNQPEPSRSQTDVTRPPATRRALPESVAPSQARQALTMVIAKTLDAPETFDSNGWLRIGLCGHQPAVGETYISTGSLYLCSVAFLPLGLPASDPFWSAPATPITSQKVWSGQTFPIDHALSERK